MLMTGRRACASAVLWTYDRHITSLLKQDPSKLAMPRLQARQAHSFLFGQARHQYQARPASWDSGCSGVMGVVLFEAHEFIFAGFDMLRARASVERHCHLIDLRSRGLRNYPCASSTLASRQL